MSGINFCIRYQSQNPTPPLSCCTTNILFHDMSYLRSILIKKDTINRCPYFDFESVFYFFNDYILKILMTYFALKGIGTSSVSARKGKINESCLPSLKQCIESERMNCPYFLH